MTKAFASRGDMSEKKMPFDEIGAGLWDFSGRINAIFKCDPSRKGKSFSYKENGRNF